MNNQIRTFLDRLDKELVPFARDGTRFDMFLLGKAALVLLYDAPLSTKDIDIVSMRDSELEPKALELFGKGSRLAKTLGLYLDSVACGLPPVPTGFVDRCERIAGSWQVLRLWKLEVHDLAATKLKSFRPQDREDLQFLCDQGLLRAANLRAALEAAFPFRSPKAEDAEDDPDNPDWSKAFASFRRVEGYLNGSLGSI